MYQNFIGIDISKNDFHVAIDIDKKTKVFKNNEEGFKQFYAEYQPHLLTSLVILETTGGYEKASLNYLQSKNIAVHRANTRKVKHFIRSYGKLGKSDAIDALALAHYGKERHKELEVFKENSYQKLLKLTQRRIELKQMLVQEKNRRQAPDQAGLENSFDKIINALQKEIELITDKIKLIIKSDKTLLDKSNILKTIPGIGEVIAFELLALLPELGTINRRKIASLAGVAPHPNESGKKTGYRSTRGGRKDIKPILFMAGITAARSKTRLGDFYQDLVQKGKKKMVALIPLMRKIVVIANAKLRDFYADLKTSTT